MSDMSELLTGLTLIVISIGALFACAPRGGKSLSFVTKPFIGPGVSIVVVAGLVIGVLLIASYFTTIDDATLTGMVKHS
jgi:hypothetical protein